MLDIGKLVVTQGETISKKKLQCVYLITSVVKLYFCVIDTIEQNVEQVTINVDEGNRQLEKGVMYKVCVCV